MSEHRNGAQWLFVHAQTLALFIKLGKRVCGIATIWKRQLVRVSVLTLDGHNIFNEGGTGPTTPWKKIKI